MFKAERLPSGNYRVQVIMKDENGHTLYKPNGKRDIRSVTASTKQEAFRKACELAGQKQLPKELEEEIHKERLSRTVGKAIEQYIDDSECRLSPSTVRGYRIKQRTCLQSIKDIPIKNLTLGDIQKAVNLDSQRLSAKSIKDAIALLQRVLILNDITLNFKRIFLPKKSKRKEPLPKESDILKSVINTKIELPCLLAMWCSLRMSEIRGLKYSDITTVDDTHYITVQRTNIYQDGHDIVREQTKTESSTRTIILPAYLYNLIISQPHKSDDEFIVKLGYNAIYKPFKRYMENIGFNDMSFHKLRHEYATILNDLGVDDDYIQANGGWATSIIMKSVYTHTTDAKNKEYQTRIDKHFNGIISDLKAAI